MSAPGGSNFQPESVSELSRFVQYMFGGLEKQLTLMSDKLDKMDVVSRSQYREDMQVLRDELKEQKAELEAYQNKLAAYGRWFVSSLVLPFVGLTVTIYGLFYGSH